MRQYGDPVFYQAGPGAGWVPIDTSLSPVAGQQISFVPAGVANPAQVPTVSGSTATYAGVGVHGATEEGDEYAGHGISAYCGGGG